MQTLILTRAFCLVAGSVLVGCSGPEEDIEGPEGRGVEYLERTEQGHELVVMYLDEDCLLVRHRGPTYNDLVREDFHCSDEELETAELLLSTEAWDEYVSVSWDGGAGGADPGENSPQSKRPFSVDVDLPSSDESSPIGSILVTRAGWEPNDFEIKSFWADATGPEAALIEYFQALNRKYVPRR